MHVIIYFWYVYSKNIFKINFRFVYGVKNIRTLYILHVKSKILNNLTALPSPVSGNSGNNRQRSAKSKILHHIIIITRTQMYIL